MPISTCNIHPHTSHRSNAAPPAQARDYMPIPSFYYAATVPNILQLLDIVKIDPQLRDKPTAARIESSTSPLTHDHAIAPGHRPKHFETPGTPYRPRKPVALGSDDCILPTASFQHATNTAPAILSSASSYRPQKRIEQSQTALKSPPSPTAKINELALASIDPGPPPPYHPISASSIVSETAFAPRNSYPVPLSTLSSSPPAPIDSLDSPASLSTSDAFRILSPVSSLRFWFVLTVLSILASLGACLGVWASLQPFLSAVASISARFLSLVSCSSVSLVWYWFSSQISLSPSSTLSTTLSTPFHFQTLSLASFTLFSIVSPSFYPQISFSVSPTSLNTLSTSFSCPTNRPFPLSTLYSTCTSAAHLRNDFIGFIDLAAPTIRHFDYPITPDIESPCPLADTGQDLDTALSNRLDKLKLAPKIAHSITDVDKLSFASVIPNDLRTVTSSVGRSISVRPHRFFFSFRFYFPSFSSIHSFLHIFGI